MLIKTIMNRIEKHKSFIYTSFKLVEESEKLSLEVGVEPRKNNQPICSGCQTAGPTYDHLPQRRFQYVPLWGIEVILLYVMRRVSCPNCGIKVEQVPWGRGKSPLTRTYSTFLAIWARRLSWQEVADVFGTSWNRVYEAVKWAVSYGLKHRDLNGITAIGVDEIAYSKGHHYLTVVYQIDKGCRRLLWIGMNRTEATLKHFFNWFGPDRSGKLRYVCSDMWKPYLNVIAKFAVNAINILDRFHIVANMNKALDQVRREEVHRLKAEGYEPVLKQSRWCILKRLKNLTEKQFASLQDLLLMNLKTMRAYLLKEDFHQFWEYTYSANAGKFLDAWCTRVMRSRIEPMKKIARSLRSHRELILNWFEAKKQFSSGIVEGLNNKIKTIVKKSYGFKRPAVLQVALYHTLADLPLPEMTHKFC